MVSESVEDSPQLADVVGANHLPGRVVAPVLVHPRPPGRPRVAKAGTVGADDQGSIRHFSPSGFACCSPRRVPQRAGTAGDPLTG